MGLIEYSAPKAETIRIINANSILTVSDETPPGGSETIGGGTDDH